MTSRIAVVAAVVSMLATVAGCARPDVVPAAASPRPVVAYEVSADAPAGAKAHRAPRFEASPSPQPRIGLIGRSGFGVASVLSP